MLRAGRLHNDPLRPFGRNRTKRSGGCLLAGGEPDLPTVRRPRKTLNGRPLSGQNRFLSQRVNHAHKAAVILRHWMFDERQHFAGWRDAHVLKTTGGLSQHFSNWKLYPSSKVTNDGKGGAIARPVGIGNTI
jgi:hypothetical protein